MVLFTKSISKPINQFCRNDFEYQMGRVIMQLMIFTILFHYIVKYFLQILAFQINFCFNCSQTLMLDEIGSKTRSKAIIKKQSQWQQQSRKVCLLWMQIRLLNKAVGACNISSNSHGVLIEKVMSRMVWRNYSNFEHSIQGGVST